MTNQSPVKVGQTYKHFKGNQYKIIAIAQNSENPDEIFVVYQTDSTTVSNQDDIHTWVRPLSMFTETIEREGKTFQRFELI